MDEWGRGKIRQAASKSDSHISLYSVFFIQITHKLSLGTCLSNIGFKNACTACTACTASKACTGCPICTGCTGGSASVSGYSVVTDGLVVVVLLFSVVIDSHH